MEVGACVLAHCERVRKTAVFLIALVAPSLHARGTSQPAQKSHEQNFTCCREEDSENDAGQVARFFALFAFRSFFVALKNNRRLEMILLVSCLCSVNICGDCLTH